MASRTQSANRSPQEPGQGRLRSPHPAPAPGGARPAAAAQRDARLRLGTAAVRPDLRRSGAARRGAARRRPRAARHRGLRARPARGAGRRAAGAVPRPLAHLPPRPVDLPRFVAPAARLRGALADQRGGRRRGEPHLSFAQDGPGAPRPAARQARQPHHRLPGGRGREDRRGDRHGHRGRPPARLRRPGGRRLAVVPGGAPAGGALRRWARRWCGAWRSISRRAARRTWTSR